jgi:hypothetical protein
VHSFNEATTQTGREMSVHTFGAWIRLRQWFDGEGQLRSHFHRRERDEVLLFAGPLLPAGAPVLLEVGFSDCDQTCVLRGHVLHAEPGERPGSWLSFETPEVVRGLIEAAAVRRRRSQRVPTELAVIARTGSSVFICRLTDLSAGGACLSGLKGLVAPGGELGLSLFGRSPSLGHLDTASVMWQQGTEAGVRFHRRSAISRQAIARLLTEAREAWLAAPEARHPASCRCSEGGRPWEHAVPSGRLAG